MGKAYTCCLNLQMGFGDLLKVGRYRLLQMISLWEAGIFWTAHKDVVNYKRSVTVKYSVGRIE